MTRIYRALSFILSVGVSATSASADDSVYFRNPGLKTFTDSDWDIELYDNCSVLKKYGSGNLIEWVGEDGNRFLRFRLENGQIGTCKSTRSDDARQRSGAPYWERAELKQIRSLAMNTKYVLRFEVRFIEGFGGSKENFWQLHSSVKGCRTAPSVMIKFDIGILRIDALDGDGRHSKIRTDIDIDRVRGRWNRMEMAFDTTEQPQMSVSFNDKPLAHFRYAIPECGLPYIKFGIYRPGVAEGGQRSIVDFDKLRLRTTD